LRACACEQALEQRREIEQLKLERDMIKSTFDDLVRARDAAIDELNQLKARMC
jgi:hypothetical protein